MKDARDATQVIYEFEKKSSGTTPSRGSRIFLGFEPDGDAFLYAVKPKERVAYHGKWSYSDGKMSLQITSSSLHVGVEFPLRLTDKRVTMPFQIFSSDRGTSQWKATILAAENGIFVAYDAAIADKELRLSQADAVKRALQFAKHRLQISKQSWTTSFGSFSHFALAVYQPTPLALFDSLATQPKDCSDTEEPIGITYLGGDDVLLTYICGLTIEIALEPPRDHLSVRPLGNSPLSGDPRVYLDPRTPGDATADPPSKTALIIAPFMEQDGKGHPNEIDTLTSWGDFFDGSPTVAPDPAKFSIVPSLKANGHGNPVTLINSEAPVEAIAKELIENPTPGILIFDTHGGDDGGLCTGDHWWGPQASVEGANINPYVISGYRGLLKHLRDAGLADLVDFERPPGASDENWNARTVRIGYIERDGDPMSLVATACLPPAFWKWARTKHGLDLRRSLVIIDACETDARPDLRNEIQSEAYFAWSTTVEGDLPDDVTKYIIASLTRPTHSAEEAFYNLMRLAKSRQMIYAEDALVREDIGSESDLNAKSSTLDRSGGSCLPSDGVQRGSCDCVLCKDGDGRTSDPHPPG